MKWAIAYKLTKKHLKGGNHPDRNKQFEYIKETVNRFHEEGELLISVDSKKTENVGEYKNNGREYAPQGQPTKVNVYDFVDKEKCKAVPYGINDIANNTGYVNVGTSYNTAEFAVSSINSWWTHLGKELYPDAKQLLITADGGRSNGPL
jgi:hypothetical protein